MPSRPRCARSASPERVSTADLAPVDEFHIRGRSATLALAAAMGVDEETSVLDIGSGIGGAPRTLAEVHGCSVTGIDLTPSLCAAAAELSRWTGLDDRTTFRVGDARALPFDDDSFDAAMTIHAVMNIADKPAVYREARRAWRTHRRSGQENRARRDVPERAPLDDAGPVTYRRPEDARVSVRSGAR